jgi:hypothetical protein
MRSAARSLAVGISMAAWFALSNHCALGTIAASTETESAMSGCPMHSAPAKKKPAAKIPCCKDVRAVVAKTVTAAGSAVRIIGAETFATGSVELSSRFPSEIEVLDTGPPERISFAELVLQESMLAHAPPVS